MEENRKPGRLEKLIAAPAKLVDLVEYQEGSVVSRTLIDKKTGTVTLFAFDETQGLSEHTAPTMQRFACWKGKRKLSYPAGLTMCREVKSSSCRRMSLML